MQKPKKTKKLNFFRTILYFPTNNKILVLIFVAWLLPEAKGELGACCRGDIVTPGEVRVSEKGAGHLGSTPLPVRAVRLSIAEVLANPDGVILTRERNLEDDLVRAKLTIRHPEILTLGGESREADENENSHDDRRVSEYQ